MRENVVSLRVITAAGKDIRTARRARKSSAGYDLTRIFVGSEGTLGIITEVTVRLYPQPEAISAAVCNFPSVQEAVQCVIETIQMGVPVARVEFLDTNCVKALNAHSQLGLRESPVLLFEFHGSPTGVAEQAAVVQDLARENGGQDFQWATRARRPFSPLESPSQGLFRWPANEAGHARAHHRRLRSDLKAGRKHRDHLGGTCQVASCPT